VKEADVVEWIAAMLAIVAIMLCGIVLLKHEDEGKEQ